MTSDAQYMSTLYFVVFFKFIFVIFYSINLYGLMFNQQIYNNTLKGVIGLEFVFMMSMAFILLYLFNKDTITVKSEEQVLIWTMAFVIVIDGFIKISSIQW